MPSGANEKPFAAAAISSKGTYVFHQIDSLHSMHIAQSNWFVQFFDLRSG